MNKKNREIAKISRNRKKSQEIAKKNEHLQINILRRTIELTLELRNCTFE